MSAWRQKNLTAIATPPPQPCEWSFFKDRVTRSVNKNSDIDTPLFKFVSISVRVSWSRTSPLFLIDLAFNDKIVKSFNFLSALLHHPLLLYSFHHSAYMPWIPASEYYWFCAVIGSHLGLYIYIWKLRGSS